MYRSSCLYSCADSRASQPRGCLLITKTATTTITYVELWSSAIFCFTLANSSSSLAASFRSSMAPVNCVNNERHHSAISRRIKLNFPTDKSIASVCSNELAMHCHVLRIQTHLRGQFYVRQTGQYNRQNTPTNIQPQSSHRRNTGQHFNASHLMLLTDLEITNYMTRMLSFDVINCDEMVI